MTEVFRVDQELKEQMVGHLDLVHLAQKEMLDLPVDLEVPDVTVCGVLLSVFSFSLALSYLFGKMRYTHDRFVVFDVFQKCIFSFVCDFLAQMSRTAISSVLFSLLVTHTNIQIHVHRNTHINTHKK